MKNVAGVALILSLTGCFAPTPMLTSQRTMTIDPTIAAKSCQELARMDADIIQRVSVLEAEQKRKNRGQAIANAAVDIGLTSLIGASVSGGANAIRTASTTADVVTAARSASQGSASLATVQDATALAAVRSQVVQTQISKGCS